MVLSRRSSVYLSKNFSNLLGDWAKSIGVEGTFAEMEGKTKPFAWDFAKTIVYNNIKKALGLDQARMVTWGAAPLNQQTREYFASLNLFLINTYGMSENAGPQTYYSPSLGKPNLKSAGFAVAGTTFWIANPDRDGNGEICFRGRNRFMGYFKDEEATRKTIDDRGYLHSGDLGHVDKDGHLFITGRIKELLVTAGGENVAPILIENEVKNAIPELSQCVVIGDNRKYLAILLTLKHVQEKAGFPGKDLDANTIKDLESKGIKGKTPEELRKNADFIKYVEAGLEAANKKAISRAQTVRKWYLLDRDFSIDADEVTPTLKLKRNIIYKNHAKEIEIMYPPEAKL
jgi:long-chain-fatty-acid--CoA ligase ACSBG